MESKLIRVYKEFEKQYQQKRWKIRRKVEMEVLDWAHRTPTDKDVDRAIKHPSLSSTENLVKIASRNMGQTADVRVKAAMAVLDRCGIGGEDGTGQSGG